MRRLSKFIKSNAKLIVGVFIGLAISGGATYAATILFNADQVGFDKTGTSLSSTDVQGALDELYDRTKFIDNIPTMQDFDKSSLASNAQTILMDKRDGNLYSVRKLADGNVWMTDNLRLIDKTISSADSNLPSGETWTVPASSISGFNSDNTNNAFLDSPYGGYYSFYTATAGWGTDSVTSGNAPKDICPKGWRLPTGGSSGEFQTLYNNYNSSALMQGVPNFTFSGRVSYDSLYNQGSGGRFWSSTVRNAISAYYLELGSSYVGPADSTTKNNGFLVRCVAI